MNEVEKKEINEDQENIINIENINNLLSFEVSHNRIIFLDKPIKNKEKLHKNWKYIYWKDYRSNLEVEILDKDYWKSAELIRLVLETRKKNKLLIIAWIILSLIMFWILASVVSSFIKPKEETKKIEPIISTQAPIFTPSEDLPKSIDNNENINIIENENKNKIVSDETNIQLAKLDYQAVELSLQIWLLNKQNEILQAELNEKTLLIEKKDNLINKQSLELADKEEKIKNLTSNEFILFIGNKIIQECEKNKNEYCKELYFKYLQK